MFPIVGSVDPDQFTAGFMGMRSAGLQKALPQTATSTIFTITGGRVLITLLLGQVGTIIQAQSNLTKLTAVPASGSSVDLCSTVDINGLESGGLLSISGTFANALQKSLSGASQGGVIYGVIVAPGTIVLNCAASSTGTIAWLAFWLTVDSGASLVAN